MFLPGVFHGGVIIDGRDATGRFAVDQEFPHPDYSAANDQNDIVRENLRFSPSVLTLGFVDVGEALKSDVRHPFATIELRSNVP